MQHRIILRKHGQPCHPEQLIQHNCLDHVGNVNHTWQYKIDQRQQAIFIDGNVYASSNLDLKNLVLSGQGIGYLPSFTVADAIQSGQLKSILTEYSAVYYPMFAVYPVRKQASKKLAVGA